MATLTIYLTHDDYSYVKTEGLSPSELFQKAIIMHKNGEVRQDKYYISEIDRLQLAIKRLQNAITQVGESQ